MKGLAKYFTDIYTNCEIPFEIKVAGNVIYTADHNLDNDYIVESSFFVGTNNVKLLVPQEYRNSIKLLEFCIKDRWKENNNDSEKVLISILENVKVSQEKIKECLPPIQDESYFIVVNLNEKLKETVEVLKNVYKDFGVLITQNSESVILFGCFENIEDHISSIKDTIDTSIYEKCYISYAKITSYDDIKNIYDDLVYKILIAKKYNVTSWILDENSLIFERFIDGLEEDAKMKIIERFIKGFSKLDNDMVQTIETFFECDLNLSEASKKLYVHRNTLIYRLEKIEKYTNYDLKKFNEAVIFKIAFFLWKQKDN